MSKETDRLKKRLDATFERYAGVASRLQPEEPELAADFAKYLCVLVSGYLEKAVSELVLDHARRSHRPRLERFVERNVRDFRNANSSKLVTLMGSFDADWERQLKAVLVDDIKAAIDTVVALRNDIAHGGQASITYIRVQQYYRGVQSAVDQIARLCAQHP